MGPCHVRTLALLLLLGTSSCQDCEDCEDHEDSSLLALRPASTPQASLEGLESILASDSASLPCLFRGAHWSLDGAHFRAKSLDGWQPIQVPNRSRLDLLICNVQNSVLAASSNTLPPAAATLVEAVGAGAVVNIAVVNSFNVELRGNLSVDGGSLVPTLVRGVAAMARVSVLLSGSGNVEARRASNVSVTRGSLVAEAMVTGDLLLCTLRLRLRDCGNVRLGRKGAAELLSSSAFPTLLSTALRAGSVNSSSVWLSVEASGNMAAGALEVWGRLVSSVFYAAALHGSRVDVRVEAAARAEAEEEVIVRQWLLQEAVRVTGVVEGSTLRCEVDQAALVGVAGAAARLQGALVPVAMALPRTVGSKVSVSLRGVAQVACNGSVLMNRAFLLGTALFMPSAEESELQVSLKDVAGVSARELQQSSWGLANEPVLWAGPFVKGAARIELEGVGLVKAEKVQMPGLVQRVWRESGVQGAQVSLSVRRSFNVACAVLEGLGSLASKVVDGTLLQQGAHGFVEILDSFNVRVEGDAELGGLVGRVHQGAVRSSSHRMEIVGSFNAKVSGNLSTQSSIFSRAIVGEVEDSEVSIRLEASGNVEAKGDVAMQGDSHLISRLQEGSFQGGSLKVELNQSGSATAGSSLSLSSASLVKDVVVGPLSNSSVKVLLQDTASARGEDVQLSRSQLLANLFPADGGSRLRARLEDSASLVASGSAALSASSLLGSLLGAAELRIKETALACGRAGRALAAEELCADGREVLKAQAAAFRRSCRPCPRPQAGA